MLAEHGDEGVEDDLGLGEVGARALDEDVLRLQADLGVVAVDDGRHGEHHALGVSGKRTWYLRQRRHTSAVPYSQQVVVYFRVVVGLVANRLFEYFLFGLVRFGLVEKVWLNWLV